MKNTLLSCLIILVMIGCSKPTDPVVDKVADCECFDGTWNMKRIITEYDMEPPTFSTGENVWEFNNQDSTFVVTNQTTYSLESGNYHFSIDDQNFFTIRDSQDSIRFEATNVYMFDETQLLLSFHPYNTGNYTFERD